MRRRWTVVGYDEKGEPWFAWTGDDFYDAYDAFLGCSKLKKWHCYMRLAEYYTWDEIDLCDDGTDEDKTGGVETTIARMVIIEEQEKPRLSIYIQRFINLFRKLLNKVRTRWTRRKSEKS